MSTNNDVHVPQPEPEKVLPPIESIVIPQTQTKSARIRWLAAMGYKTAEISNYLGIKYQMVRNISTSQPKRAAREDLPPLVIAYKEEVDDVMALMDHALDASLKKERVERKKAEKDQRRSDREAFGQDDFEGGEDE